MMSTVRKHCTKSSVWLVIDGGVYDCTSLLKGHPVCSQAIMLAAGGDATKVFSAVASGKVRSKLSEFYLGELSAADKKAALEAKQKKKLSAQIKKVFSLKPNVQVNKDVDSPQDLVALNQKEWVEFELIKKTKVS